MAGRAPFQAPGDFQPLSESERRIRARILSSDLPGIPKEFVQWLKSQLELNPPSFTTSGSSGSSGSTPTGTGFRHVTGGVEDGAAKLVDTADINDDQVTNAKLANMAGSSIKGNINIGANDPADLTPGQVRTLLGTPIPTGTGFPHVTGGAYDSASKLVDTADINNDQVTYAKMQNVSATARLLGRITAGAGDPEELTGTQATTLLDVFTSVLKGLVPASGGGTTTFLRADGTFAAPTASVAFQSFSKDLGAASNSGSFALTGLSGLTSDKPVTAFQTADPIASKGSAQDEPEMDQIQITGIVESATSIRFRWWAPSVVVGTYNFAYLVGV